MTSARYIIGDTRDVTASLRDGSVDLILTSPPFLALRSYLPADHPDKHREIGSEATPADFLDVLLDLAVEWRRVLAPHGSIAVELGDTYAGSGSPGGDYAENRLRAGQPRTTYASARARAHRDAWPLDKSLCGIPTLFAWSLAYGRNLLRPDRTLEPWRVRNVVAWCRPNPPVGALGDKFRPATSYMTVATVARDRWFDLDAVRTPHTKPDGNGMMRAKKQTTGARNDDGRPFYNEGHPAGAPPLDYWVIPTEPYAGSHYATWPRDLLVRPIKAMCPLKVCTVCGEPSRRITSEPEYVPSATNRGGVMLSEAERVADKANQWVGSNGAGKASVIRHTETLGWTDCGHNAWRNGLVLDPFAGSGTTLAVATGHGRDAIGIDLDARNADLALERVGPMFLTVEHHQERAA